MGDEYRALEEAQQSVICKADGRHPANLVSCRPRHQGPRHDVRLPDGCGRRLTFIDQCVDPVGAIIREHDEENAEATAAALARELRVLTDELLGTGANPDDPVNMSPPLAPV